MTILTLLIDSNLLDHSNWRMPIAFDSNESSDLKVGRPDKLTLGKMWNHFQAMILTTRAFTRRNATWGYMKEIAKFGEPWVTSSYKVCAPSMNFILWSNSVCAFRNASVRDRPYKLYDTMPACVRLWIWTIQMRFAVGRTERMLDGQAPEVRNNSKV